MTTKTVEAGCADAHVRRCRRDAADLERAFEAVFDEYGQWRLIEGEERAVRTVPWEWLVDEFVDMRGGPGGAVRNALVLRARDASRRVFRLDLVEAGFGDGPCVLAWRRRPRRSSVVSAPD